jgi:hypothetical protein
MIVNQQKKHPDMAEQKSVRRLITDEDIKNSLTREALMQGVREDIKEIYNRKK